MLVELACGASVAVCDKNKIEAALGRTIVSSDVVVVILCGGSNVTIEMLEQWRREFQIST